VIVGTYKDYIRSTSLLWPCNVDLGLNLFFQLSVVWRAV